MEGWEKGGRPGPWGPLQPAKASRSGSSRGRIRLAPPARLRTPTLTLLGPLGLALEKGRARPGPSAWWEAPNTCSFQGGSLEVQDGAGAGREAEGARDTAPSGRSQWRVWGFCNFWLKYHIHTEKYTHLKCVLTELS